MSRDVTGYCAFHAFAGTESERETCEDCHAMQKMGERMFHPMTPEECSCVDCVEIRNARELVRLREAISTTNAQIHQQAEMLAQRWDTIERLQARLSAVEAERDRLQRVNKCVYEVCGCGNMADAHCMICCRPLTEHRLIPTRELAEIQRRFAFYAEDAAERDRLKAALQQARQDFGMVACDGSTAGIAAARVDTALTPQGQSTDGETR